VQKIQLDYQNHAGDASRKQDKRSSIKCPERTHQSGFA